MNITTPAELKSELIRVLGSQIGTYRRPGLADTLAIWVLDRPVPDKWKVLQASPDANPANGLEVLIQYTPEYQKKKRNFGSTLVGEGWRVWLVFHESRQNPQSALRSIIANFDTTGDFMPIPSNDLLPAQYSVVIKGKLIISEVS